MSQTWLSLLCPSCRPADLKRWLDTLYANCDNPKGIQLSLTLEQEVFDINRERWGGIKFTIVKPKQYAINELVEMCYKQSTSPFIFLSGDDSICHTAHWDTIFKNEIDKYPDGVVLVYPNDLIFGEKLACYPVTSRIVMDQMPWPLPFKRYAVDDTIFNIVPKERRIYLPDVIMEHDHLVDDGPGVPVKRYGKTKYYPLNPEIMSIERPMYESQEPLRNTIRMRLEDIAGIKREEVKVMIGVRTAEFGRRADFHDYLNLMDKPANTIMAACHGQSPAQNANLIIKNAFASKCSHVLFIDDDVLVNKDTLTRLLSHNKEIVCGLYLMRDYPHRPVIFKEMVTEGYFLFDELGDQTGLKEVVNCGLGCTLIKTDVFLNMEYPYVRLGEIAHEGWEDDTGFFMRARKKGHKIYCDLDAPVGHIASVVVRPAFINGKWHTTYKTNSEETVVLN